MRKFTKILMTISEAPTLPSEFHRELWLVFVRLHGRGPWELICAGREAIAKKTVEIYTSQGLEILLVPSKESGEKQPTHYPFRQVWT